MRKPKGRQCLCTVCGLMFGSERAFDAHRVGDFGSSSNPRHCLTVAEMTAHKRLEHNGAKDVWQMKLTVPFPTAP